jgi:membrane associated rhomboid family serine protease
MRSTLRLLGTLTPTTGWILGLNVALFVAQNLSSHVTAWLGLDPARVVGAPWTLVTYAFLHASVSHLLFNMLMLYFFAGDLDKFLGRTRFLILYLGGALAGGAAFALLFPPGRLLIGASAALYSILTAFYFYFPETEILVWFVLPVKLRVVVVILFSVSLFFSFFGNSADGVAHLAHLGGMVFAFLYVHRAWRPVAIVRELKYRWRRRRFTRIQ